MLSMVNHFPDYQFVIAGAPSQDFSFYNQFIDSANVNFVSVGRTGGEEEGTT